MTQLVPINDTDRELLAQPSIASQMPVVFANGARWDEMTGDCKICCEEIPTENFTGRVTRLMESVATVDAVGVCPTCKIVSRFNYRLHNDMRLSGRTDNGWAQWQFRPTLLARVMKSVKDVFS